MLTPTGVTSSAYWNAIKAGNPTHVRMTFLGQNIVLDDSDISLTGGLTITDIINGDVDLVFGKAVAKQITVHILNSSKLDGLIWTSEFTLEMGVDIGTPAVTYWVNIGYFTGERPKNITTVNVITFTAYDRMTKFDVLADQFVQNISYPITVQNIYNNLCTYVGIDKVSGDELQNIMSRSYASAPVEMTGYTCRDILAWIAEACGCYARINSAGKCQMVWFTDNTSHALTGDEEFNVESGDINDGLTWDEADTYKWNDFDNFTWDEVCGYQEMYSIDQIQVKQLGADVNINYPAFYGWNVYMIVDNPFLSVSNASDVTNYIAPLYNRMDTFGGYMPLNIECIGCWLVEAGDVITADVGTNTLSLPVFTRTLRWNGSVNDTYEATGNKDRKTYATESDRQQAITAKYIRLFVEDNYYHTQSGIEITANGVTISGSKSINIQSGSALDNNGVINIRSGGDFNIKTGGLFSIDSGNFSIDSTGNVAMKGNVEISSGKDLTVKSGGNFNVNSGGNIDIHGTGTLELIGSNVTIKSGSTFNLQSDNANISSYDGYFNIVKKFNNNKCCLSIGGNLHGVDDAKFYGTFQPYQGARVSNGQTYNFYGLEIHEQDYLTVDPVNFSDISMYLGMHPRSDGTFHPLLNGHGMWYVDGAYTASYLDAEFGSIELDLGIKAKTGVFTTSVTSASYITSSSRDIKHNISPIGDVGDIIDSLEPVTYVYDNDPDERTRHGLIYEDTVEIFPDICTDDETNKAINYVDLVSVLLKEVQSLRSRVKSLEEREVV